MALPVSSGLVLHLEVDSGVTVSGGTVTGWLDGSGQGNSLFAAGNPQFVAGQTPTGQAAIVFDGVGDLLQRVDVVAPIQNLPAGNQDRTVFFVVDYVNPEGVSAGLAYGDGVKNETFGLVANKQGNLAIQGWGADLPASNNGVTGGFLVQSAVLSNNTTFHYRDGVLIDSDSKVFSTDVRKLVLGAEIAGFGEAQMKISAVLIYDRALSGAERAEVEQYLQAKYIFSAGNVPPAALADQFTYVEDTPFQGNVLTNDSDPDGDPLTALLIAGPAHGTATVNPNGSFVYNPALHYNGADSFTYTAFDGRGGTSVATVSLAGTPVDDPATAVPDSYNAVAETTLVVSAGQGVLANDSDPEGDPFTANLISGPANGTLSLASTGAFSYTPNSGFAGPDSFIYAVTGGSGATVNLMVAEPGQDSAPPETDADVAVLANGGTTIVDVLRDDFDSSGLNPASVTIVSAPQRGTIVGVDPATGRVEYQHDGSGSPDSFAYTVADAFGNVSAPTTVSVSLGNTALSLAGFSDELVIDRTTMNSQSAAFQPISMAFLPDNRMLLLSKDGEILIVDPESGASSSYMKINNINALQELGLLDITLDPDFENNGYFYLYYTPSDPGFARISRFQHQENSGGVTSSASTASETVLWQDTDPYYRCCHYGGGLDFGPDGKLWLTTADKFRSSTAGESVGGDDVMLDLNSTTGKIVRINSDGSIPDGSDGWAANPWAEPNDGGNDSIWAYGLRNPFRARWDDVYGHFYIGEVGGNQQTVAHDDLHVASLSSPGAFYGWPFYEGTPNTYVNAGRSTYDPADFPLPDNDPGNAAEGDFYSAPIWSLPHNGLAASLTGGEVYRGEMFPDEWQGVYFYGDYTRDYIRYLRLDHTGTQVLGDFAFKPSAQLPGNTNDVVAIGVGNDGALYYALIGSGEVRRVTFGTNDAPSILSAAMEPTAGEPPLTVTFTASVADPDGDAMTYTLNLGDGTVLTGVVAPSGTISASHVYAGEGNYLISLSVSDPGHTTHSQALEVTVGEVNDPPQIGGTDSDAETVSVGEVVTFTATATDPDNDTLTYTWRFGDGTSASGTVDPSGQVSASHAYASDGVYQAYLEVTDGTVTTVSPNLSIQVGQASTIPVTSGLVLLLEADIKIGLGTGNTVTAWLDGSGQGNNLSAQGNPQLLSGQTPSGRPAIVFDGAGDLLQRIDATAPIQNLPSGSQDRTVFFVVDYVNPEGVSAGLVYGDGAKNEAFGLVANKQGNLAIQGWGGDLPASSNGVTGGFLVQSAVLSNNTTFHYRNGTLIDSDSKVFNTDVQKLVLGAEIAGLGEAQMKISAVLIYDRALSAAERAQVEDYLHGKYIGNQPATAVADSYNVAAGTTLEICACEGVLVNDSDPEGDAFTASLLSGPANGTLSFDPAGGFTYTPNAGFVGEDSFVYEITGGSTATVTLTVREIDQGELVTAGLVAAYMSYENVALGAGNVVAGWLDGSGRGNDLVALGDPTLVQGTTPTGQPAIVFDGTGDLLQRINATDTLNGLPGSNQDRTVFLVVDYVNPEGVSAGVVFGDGAKNEAFGLVANKQGNLAIQGWGGDLPSITNGVTGGFLVQSAVLSNNTTFHYRNGALIDSDSKVFNTDLQKLVLGAEIAGLGEAQMQIAALLIYDRALTESERMSVETHLQHLFVDDTFFLI